MKRPTQQVVVGITDDGPVRVLINEVASIKCHSFEIRPVPREDDDYHVIKPSMLYRMQPEQFELILRFRPEADDGLQFRVFLREQEIPLDAIRFHGGKVPDQL